MPETEEEKKWTEADLKAYDQAAVDHFEQTMRLSQALRQAWKPEPEEPQPGSEEAKEAIKDAIKQGNE